LTNAAGLLGCTCCITLVAALSAAAATGARWSVSLFNSTGAKSLSNGRRCSTFVITEWSAHGECPHAG
jgi:hypothetical protein